MPGAKRLHQQPSAKVEQITIWQVWKSFLGLLSAFLVRLRKILGSTRPSSPEVAFAERVTLAAMAIALAMVFIALGLLALLPVLRAYDIAPEALGTALSSTAVVAALAKLLGRGDAG